MIDWVRQLNPGIKERSIEREMEKLLVNAFRTNLRVLIIIDELSAEQKSTIQNLINYFKLATDDPIQFGAYIVRRSAALTSKPGGADLAGGSVGGVCVDGAGVRKAKYHGNGQRIHPL
ncbi:MAG: hypothetical protein H6557_34175 [Lewinellaceae bacterium]|nr:hypothetical protein [Lewinellaceae bacterium]